jgi:V8-like Glu-specific endopeptidase
MKNIIQGFLSITFGVIFALFLLVVFSLHPQPESPYSYETTSTHYSVSDKQAIRRSVNSAVRVVSMDFAAGNMSSLSGTYFTSKGKFYVLTSAHGILKGCESIIVFHLEENKNCINMVKIDRQSDYDIFQVEKIDSREPIKIPNALANWRKSYNLLDKTYYTGYPNSIGPTTWTGSISGFTGEYLIIQSYAWSGASGSGVFDEQGELIGIVMALDVGSNEYGYQVLNNFVILVPVWKIDFSSVLE